MANINPDDTTEPIESVQSSEVPQGNQKVCKACTYAGTVHTCSPGHLADTEGVKALSSKADNPGEISDGYHTFNELYEFRLLYNAALWNEWAKQKLYKVHKSWHHADEPHDSIFGKGWFIVVAELPTGQISNHYPPEDWELFQVTETPVAHAWDGHTTADVADRLRRFVQGNDLLAPDSTPPLQPSDAPSNGGGSQDSIDTTDLDEIIATYDIYGYADRYNPDKNLRLFKEALTAWHKTQLKAAIPKKVAGCSEHPWGSESCTRWFECPKIYGHNRAIDLMQSNLEKL